MVPESWFGENEMTMSQWDCVQLPSSSLCALLSKQQEEHKYNKTFAAI